jgi:hypothetical protein
MATMMARGTVTTMGRGRPGAAMRLHLSTTLYDLITGIQDIVGPEDDGLVVATVRHLLGSGRLTGLGPDPSVPTAAPEVIVVAHWKRRGQTPERGGSPVALRPESRLKGIAEATVRVAD